VCSRRLEFSDTLPGRVEYPTKDAEECEKNGQCSLKPLSEGLLPHAHAQNAGQIWGSTAEHMK
jgi:hypothetical protein